MNELIFSAPGRVELGGNHTDHQRGCVLAAAIDRTTALRYMGAAGWTPDTATAALLSGSFPGAMTR